MYWRKMGLMGHTHGLMGLPCFLNEKTWSLAEHNTGPMRQAPIGHLVAKTKSQPTINDRDFDIRYNIKPY